MDFRKELGKRLKEEREKTGLNQRELGSAGGVAANTQSQYESGERVPDAEYLRGTMSLGVDVMYLLTGKRSDSLPTSVEASPETSGMLAGESLGSRLSQECTRIGLLEWKLAEAAGVPMRTYGNWVTGKATPDANDLAALAQAGVDVQFVITGQRGSMVGKGMRSMAVPSELAGLFEEWMHLHFSGVLTVDAIPVWAAAIRALNPTRINTTAEAPTVATNVGGVEQETYKRVAANLLLRELDDVTPSEPKPTSKKSQATPSGKTQKTK